MALTGADSVSARSRSRSNRPSLSRQPKYAVPIWKIRSAPLRWYRDRPPSPRVVHAPGRGRPFVQSHHAADDNDPKLIAETLTNDSGRNAFARPRGPPPRIFADGTVSPSPL